MNKYIEINAILSVFAKNYMELKKDLPIRPSEMAVLNIITETKGPYTSVMIAKMLNVSKPMITAHMTSLKKKGYIYKESCQNDKRVFYICPTQKAIDLVEKTKVDLTNQLDDLMEKMGEDEFKMFVHLVDKANHILRKGE